ncbi:B-cell receptor CD22 isoform X2 [Sinocyclocheilus grahami]|uniref:B-cell receptor CD22 isoform X2 n=1 Tax=Sinocyclocheilus grahami TaxID=75366 RepID=UPI0007AD4D65|nr:PREDICTED: B-cell receptor CD22-like isoform X2 [Sinocyclocheilus grahami]
MALDALIRSFAIMSACVFGPSAAVSLSVPGRVLALEGSCLVIPCSFSPAPAAQTMQLRLIRSSAPVFMMLRRPVFSSERGDAVHPDFRERTALAGNISAGDCSVSISSVRRDDRNTYELQMRERGQRAWPAGSKVNVSVAGSPEPPQLTDPGPVKEGQRLVLNCSARLSCPSDRPRLLWKWERGDPAGSSVHGDTELQRGPGGLPVLQTSLVFTVPRHTNPRVRCELEYPNNRRSSATREILVHFPPRDVWVQVLSASVRLGGNALLLCSCKADPPVSEYQWWSVQSGNTQILPKRTHTVRIYNISRDTRVQCSAANPLGRASSRPTPLNTLYAPVIVSRSSCDWDGTLLSCSCVVDSNPRAAITWSVNGTHLSDRFNTSSSYDNHIVMATLRGISDASLPVECHAVSALGNHSLLLYEPHEGGLIWTVIPTAGAVLLLLLLFLLLFFCCCRTIRRPPAVRPELLGVCQERMPLYINCSEVTNVYSNGSYQLVYQNCTPLFVRSKQMHKRQRRGARRQRAQTPVTADSDTAVYVEVL